MDSNGGSHWPGAENTIARASGMRRAGSKPARKYATAYSSAEGRSRRTASARRSGGRVQDACRLAVDGFDSSARISTVWKSASSAIGLPKITSHPAGSLCDQPDALERHPRRSNVAGHREGPEEPVEHGAGGLGESATRLPASISTLVQRQPFDAHPPSHIRRGSRRQRCHPLAPPFRHRSPRRSAHRRHPALLVGDRAGRGDPAEAGLIPWKWSMPAFAGSSRSIPGSTPWSS